MSINTITVKRINTDLVRTAVKELGISQKRSIADRTGLSISTCTNILKELLEEGEVLEVQTAPSTGGRPGRQFVYNEAYAYTALIYAGIEEKRYRIFGAVSSMKGEIVYEISREAEAVTAADIETLFADLQIEFPKIKVCAVGVPGVVRDGRILACDIKELINTDLHEQLTNRFDKEFVIENDVNCAVLGCRSLFEKREASQSESLVYLYYPDEYTPGAGIVINGKLLRGRTNFAGEVGHLPFNDNRNDKKNDRLTASIGDALLSVNCVINPDLIVLTGNEFPDSLHQSLLAYLRGKVPSDHFPNFSIDDNMHTSYLEGLKILGFQKLSCGLEILEREI